LAAAASRGNGRLKFAERLSRLGSYSGFLESKCALLRVLRSLKEKQRENWTQYCNECFGIKNID
jgi:hypothetical protein